MGTNVTRGRSIDISDSKESPRVAVVNETLARDLFGYGDPLGKRITLKNQSDRDLAIVGVVRDTGYRGYRRSDAPAVYTSALQNARARGFLTLAVRTQGDPLRLVGPVRRVAAQLGVERPVSISTLENRLDNSVVHERLIAWLSSVFAIAAVVLACVGLYGIMSYTVEQRTKEIGIRMALGAARSGVVELVLRQVLVLAAFGVAVGIPASIASLRIGSSLLFGLAPTDWRTIAGAALILIVVAGLAGFLPARRAAGLNPMEALRWE